MKAYIDKRKCSSDNRICKLLTECPEKAISWVEDEDEPLGSRMEIDEKNAMDAVFVCLCVAEIA